MYASRYVFLKCAKHWDHQNDDVQKHIPVEPWGKKSEKKVEYFEKFTIFHQNEASLWRLARSFPVYGWEKCGRKNFEMWMQKGTQNEASKNTSPWSRGIKKAEKTSNLVRLFRWNEASQWRLVCRFPVYGWKKTCSQSSVPTAHFFNKCFRMKNEYRYTFQTNSENFIWKLAELRWATLALLVYLSNSS